MWLVKCGENLQIIELVASGTLFSFKSSSVYTFGLPDDSMERIVVKHKGRELTDEGKTLLEDGVNPGDELEVILIDQRPIIIIKHPE